MNLRTAEPAATEFDRIGGAAAVDALVEAFYRNMDERPAAADIRAIHDADLGPTKSVLKLYLGEWLGGPAEYSRRRGHPRLRMRHMRFQIGVAERDAWLACMDAALDETVKDAALKGRLSHAFHKLADWLRNDPENQHDRHQ